MKTTYFSAFLLLLAAVAGFVALQAGEPKAGEDADLKKRLTPLQYDVTQKSGTEPAFHNEYWDNHKDGIYVSRISGEALFSSKDKFESGTGWPSFSKVLNPAAVKVVEDTSAGMVRGEVRETKANAHLGHLFDDGPQPTGQRYCMNSAALRFVPVEDLEKEKLGQFASEFAKK